MASKQVQKNVTMATQAMVTAELGTAQQSKLAGSAAEAVPQLLTPASSVLLASTRMMQLILKTELNYVETV